MDDKAFKKLSSLLDKKVKPIHGELAKIDRDLRDLKLETTRNSIGLHKVEKELARFDSNIETLNEGTETLLVDVNSLQDTTKGIWDKIRKQAGLSPN